MSQIIRSDEWINLFLKKLGIDSSSVRRVIIDAKAGEALIVYIEHYGTEGLIDIRPPETSEVKIIVNG